MKTLENVLHLRLGYHIVNITGKSQLNFLCVSGHNIGSHYMKM